MNNRTIPAAEITRALNGSGDWEYRVEVRRPGGASWTDLSNVAGGDWTLGITVRNESPDQPVGEFTARFLMHADGDSLAPGIASPLNTTTAFDPHLYPGVSIRIDATNLASGETRATATWRRWLEGEIENVAWPTDEVICTCTTQDGRLFDAQIEDEETRGAPDPGVPVQDEIQGLAERWMTDPPALYVPVDPEWNVGEYIPEGSVGEQARSLAQAQGWDLRYRWDDGLGAYRWTLYLPDRDRTTIDLTLGGEHVIDIPGLEVRREYVRNAFTGRYVGEDGGEQVRTLENADSIARFGRRWAEIVEDDTSPIRTAAQMDALLGYAESDLSDVQTEKRARIPFLPWLELHDRIRITGDGIRFTADQDYAVTGLSHEVDADGGAHTVVSLRGGSPVGQYFAWLKRSSRAAERPDLTLSVTPLEKTETTHTYRITRDSAAIAEVWRYSRTVAQDATVPDIEEVQAVDEPVALTFPSTGAIDVTIPVPEPDTVTYEWYAPYTDDLQPGIVAGPVEVDPLDPDPATFDVEFVESVDGTESTLYLTPNDPLGTVTAVELYELRNGAETGPITPTLSGGVYEYTFALDPKHVVILWGHALRGTDAPLPLGPWTADSNKDANVISLSVAYDGNGTASITANMDTDTAIGLGGTQYRVDGGAWTDAAVGVGYTAVFDVTQTTSPQDVEVRGVNPAGSIGPVRSIEVEAYNPATVPGAGLIYDVALTVEDIGTGLRYTATWGIGATDDSVQDIEVEFWEATQPAPTHTSAALSANSTSYQWENAGATATASNRFFAVARVVYTATAKNAAEEQSPPVPLS